MTRHKNKNSNSPQNHKPARFIKASGLGTVGPWIKTNSGTRAPCIGAPTWRMLIKRNGPCFNLLLLLLMKEKSEMRSFRYRSEHGSTYPGFLFRHPKCFTRDIFRGRGRWWLCHENRKSKLVAYFSSFLCCCLSHSCRSHNDSEGKKVGSSPCHN